MYIKKNCWEELKCGREPNGSKIGELGVCPVPLEERLDGIHDGKNSGRSCWIVAGSLCNGEVQGTFAQKFKNCFNCEFYNLVKEEEDAQFKLSAGLLQKLKT